jgi:hypothetical protein
MPPANWTIPQADPCFRHHTQDIRSEGWAVCWKSSAGRSLSTPRS